MSVNTTIDEAIREAYASVPTDVVIINTLELYHPGFINFEGNPGALRVANQMEEVIARLEDSAPRDAGALVTFYPYAFRIEFPTISSELPTEFNLIIDNVEGIIKNLDRIVYQDDPIEIIYRRYISSNLDAPQHAFPLKLEINNITVNTFTIRAAVGYKDFYNKQFPGVYYRTQDFPFLRLR